MAMNPPRPPQVPNPLVVAPSLPPPGTVRPLQGPQNPVRNLPLSPPSPNPAEGLNPAPLDPLWMSEASLFLRIKRHWKDFRPRDYQIAVRDGLMDKIAREDAQETLRMAESLKQAGIAPGTAFDEAMREIALHL